MGKLLLQTGNGITLRQKYRNAVFSRPTSSKERDLLGGDEVCVVIEHADILDVVKALNSAYWEEIRQRS
jgi:hypothetical protein